MSLAVEVARVTGAKLRGFFNHIKSAKMTLSQVLDNTVVYVKRTKKGLKKSKKINYELVSLWPGPGMNILAFFIFPNLV